MPFRLSRAVAALVLAVIPACSLVGGSSDDPTAADPEPTPVEIEAQLTAARTPNIVVFMTDDQTVAQMEVLAGVQRELVEQGMRFTQSFVNLPSCCPSRATFLTGQHAANHGVLTNSGHSGGFGAFEDQETTLPVALEQAGYHTVFVGKYLNGFGLLTSVRYTPPGWSDFRGLLSPTEVLYHSPSFWDNGVVVSHGEDDHAVDLITEHASDAMVSAADAGAPVFAWVSYPAPHAQAGAAFGTFNLFDLQREAAEATDAVFLQPPVPTDRHRGTFADVDVPPKPSLNEWDVSDKPAFLTRRLRSAEEMEEVQRFHQAALESLLAVDESVVKLIETIKSASPERDTWFIFTSDNGLLLGEHRHFGVKYFPYEETVRVPLVIAGPGIEPGSSSNAVTSNIDLAPTILELAGATALREADGMSLAGVATGDEQPRGRAVLIEGFVLRPGSPPYRGVHTGDSVYIEWLTGERELYDLVVDPYQLDNIVDVPAASELLARNLALLDELDACAGPECSEIGDELEPPGPPTS